MTTHQSIILKSFFFGLIWVFSLGSWVFGQAIHKDSSAIRSWATVCTVERGYINLADTTVRDNNSNRPTMGIEEDATGAADGRVISLGDGGSATYVLDDLIRDIEGPDFAVFENGFREQTPPQLWFLELAFVEVSSDGMHFVRFPSTSNTQTGTQVTTFGQLDTAAIYNLAGKYPVMYGTPFDLSQLQDSVKVDINNISHIRIIDVVGSLDPDFASYDSQGKPINDPFPTPFWTGGFDLDALAILDEATNTEVQGSGGEVRMEVFPNPVSAGQPVQIISHGQDPFSIKVLDSHGRPLTIPHSPFTIHHSPFTIHTPGLYFVIISTAQKQITKKLIVH